MFAVAVSKLKLNPIVTVLYSNDPKNALILHDNQNIIITLIYFSKQILYFHPLKTSIYLFKYAFANR